MTNTAAPIAAIAVGASRRRIIDTFLSAGALSPETAIAFDPDRQLLSRMAARMEADGVLRRTADGRLWMDEAAMRVSRTRRVRRLAILLALVAVLYVLSVALAPL